MNIPVRAPNPWAYDETAPLGSARNPASLDEDMGFENDTLPVDHPAVLEAQAKWQAARLSDVELVALNKIQRQHGREERRAGGSR